MKNWLKSKICHYTLFTKFIHTEFILFQYRWPIFTKPIFNYDSVSWTEMIPSIFISLSHGSQLSFMLDISRLLNHSSNQSAQTDKPTRNCLIWRHRNDILMWLFDHHQQGLKKKLLVFFCSDIIEKLCQYLKTYERKAKDGESKTMIMSPGCQEEQ